MVKLSVLSRITSFTLAVNAFPCQGRRCGKIWIRYMQAIGCNSCLRWVRELIFWPRMLSEIRSWGHVKHVPHTVDVKLQNRFTCMRYLTGPGKRFQSCLKRWAIEWNITSLATEYLTPSSAIMVHTIRIQMGFSHKPSIPGHSQANGATEAAVKMEKMQRDRWCHYIKLMQRLQENLI